MFNCSSQAAAIYSLNLFLIFKIFVLLIQSNYEITHYLFIYEITHAQHLLSDELDPSPPLPLFPPLELLCTGRIIRCKVKIISGGNGPREAATPV